MISVNEQLAKDLHKPVIKKFNNNNKKTQKKPRKISVRLKDNIWATDSVEMQSLSSKNKNVTYLCVTDIFTKYTWVKPLQNKKWKTVLNAFIKIVNESNRKPNKIWIDQENFTINLCKNG